jgi:tol-pal system protein YbgF
MYIVLMKRATALLTLTSLLWLNGCATQADLQAEQRMRDSMRAQLADSYATSAALQSELAKARGEIDELRHRIDRVARTRPAVSPQMQALEERIAAMERQTTVRREEPLPLVVPPPSPHTPEATPPLSTPENPQLATLPPPPAPLPPSPPSLALPPEDEVSLAKEPFEAQEEYRTAWQALSDQQYDKAIQQFRTFQRKNSTSEMADDAQYWIGESYFTRRDYNRAILEFNDVLKYRKGDKVPAALLRQAEAFVEIGDKTDARLILQKLLNDYPNSLQAKDARERLQSLGR